MKKLLKQMTKDDLIELIDDRLFIVEPYDVFKILHNKLMKKFDTHCQKECPISNGLGDFKEYEKWSKEGDSMRKQFDELYKEYERINQTKKEINDI